jgi:hypothetical protein
LSGRRLEVDLVEVAKDDQEIIARVAALDIGKAEVVCCVRVPGSGPRQGRMQEVRTYSTMTRSLLAMSDWLAGLGVTRVVMEATSDYVRPALYAPVFPRRAPRVNVRITWPALVAVTGHPGAHTVSGPAPVERAAVAPAKAGAAPLALVRSSARRWAVRLDSTALGDLWARLLEVEFVDRSVALAAKLTKEAAGFFGILLTVLFGVSFTTALQRAYLRALAAPRRVCAEQGPWSAVGRCGPAVLRPDRRSALVRRCAVRHGGSLLIRPRM